MTEKSEVEEIEEEIVEEVVEEIPEELTRDDFETDEEFESAVEQHKEDKLEPWQKTGEEDFPDVSAQTHVRIKSKLKGRISDRDEEIERLQKENEALKAPKQQEPVSTLKRPQKDDFETDEEYQAAKDKHEDALLQDRITRADLKTTQEKAQNKFFEEQAVAVDNHYERADKLIADAGINPEVYQKADANVRQAVEMILPKEGNFITDHIISLLGEGSEKVMYFLGNPKNKGVLNEFKSLLLEDKNGMKAAIYLGQQKERLTNPKKRTSQAPAPSAQLKGDAPLSGNIGKLKKDYAQAHKKGNHQGAYNAKKAAKAAGADVSTW